MNSIIDFIKISLLIIFVIVMAYWRAVGFAPLDEPIANFYKNYPLLTGMFCLILGPIFFYRDCKFYKKEPAIFKKIFCFKSALLIPIGLYLIFIGTKTC